MKTLLTLTFFSLAAVAFAQDKYFTRNGTITFYSSTPVEDIKAENFGVNAVLDAKTGDLEFSLLMKSFNFKKALMQEHFNENYVESDKFPKATFKGKIENSGNVDFSKDGSYPVQVTGTLTIHGVAKPVSSSGTINIKSGMLNANSVFKVKPEDHDIAIPSVVRDKIANDIEVTVNVDLEPLKK